MNRRVWTIAGAVVLGVVGALAMVSYVNSAEDRALAGEKVVKVLVADQVIPAGTPGEDLQPSVRTERVPAKVRAKGAVSRLSDLNGRVAAVDITAGEQLIVARFVGPDQVSKGVGVVRVPKGLLETTVSLQPERAMGGQLKPGLKVAVFASFDKSGTDSVTGIILHKALVTNVQIDQNSEVPQDHSKAPSQNLFVTIAGSPSDLERLTFAVEHGRIWLAAEPSDAIETPAPVVTPGVVFGGQP